MKPVAGLLLLLALALGAQPPAPPADRPGVVALSFNIRNAYADGVDAKVGNAWPQRRPLALGLLRDLDPDLVGLQEVTDGQLKDLQEGYEVFQRVELAFLHRKDRLEVLEGGFLTLGAFGNPDPWGDRWALWQRFRARNGGRSFVVINTHLSTGLDHLPQARLVLALAAEKGRDGTPVLVMGDFNFDAAPLLARRGFRDALADRGGTFHAFKGGRAGERIDFIAQRGFRVLGGGVDTRDDRTGPWTLYPSDHFPVWARVAPGE